jgi:AsmA protein
VLTLEGQGRTANPVGLGIPVAIDGPWADPRIYPDMAGMMDNPEAAYAKLKEMGKGLFGGDGANGGSNGGSSDTLGGQLGETLGNLLQQGLSQSRGMPTSPAPQTPPSATTPPPQTDPPQAQPDSQPMNDVLRQLFNR